MAEPYRDDAEHLAAEMAWLGRLLERAVIDGRAQAGTGSNDIFKGLYISDAEIDHLLKRGDTPLEPVPGALEAAAWREQIDARLEASLAQRIPLALPRLRRLFALTPFENALVVLALAPEIDLAYERLFAYLQDDLSRKSPTVDLALRLLCNTDVERLAARPAFSPHAPLFRLGVLRPLHRSELPLLARPLILDELVAGFLLRTATSGLGKWITRLDTHCPIEGLRWPKPLCDSHAA
jgi:hypothetical protein